MAETCHAGAALKPVAPVIHPGWDVRCSCSWICRLVGERGGRIDHHDGRQDGHT